MAYKRCMLISEMVVGTRVGRLTVLELMPTGGGRRKARVLCDCGKEKFVEVASLGQDTFSCGCLASEQMQYGLRLKHGMAKKVDGRTQRFYRIWEGMKFRGFWAEKSITEDAKNQWARYGGRGITLCKEWMEFENFYADMGESYEAHVKEFGENNTSIDRIDNNKGYYKENCRWATRSEQRLNQKRNAK